MQFNGLYNVIDVYSKNAIINRHHGKGHVYRKSKTIGIISGNRCRNKVCNHIHHSQQKKGNTGNRCDNKVYNHIHHSQQKKTITNEKRSKHN